MLKNNNKGYFLTEVIIVITIVALAITVLYVNSMSTYIKQDNDLTKFNTSDGIYSAGAIKDYFENQETTLKNQTAETGYVNVFNYFESSDVTFDKKFFNSLDVNKIYFTKYNVKLFVDNMDIVASIKKDLRTLKYDEDLCEYRYIVVFNDKSYSTIGVDCYE